AATATFSKPKVLNKADELFDEIFASSTKSRIESTDKLDSKSKSTAWAKTKSFPETSPSSSISSLSLSQPPLPVTVVSSTPRNDDKAPSTCQPSMKKADSAEAIFTAKLKRKIVQPKRFYEEPITQIKCIRSEKEMYTVVRHVKQAHQCLESGEAQQISDDIVYYMDNVCNEKDKNIRYL
uniref:WAPL domain-containing protein n=1 Tax=Romanomermis culicivorax TaxID=13658 RepID=A0A915KE46_ROMCU